MFHCLLLLSLNVSVSCLVHVFIFDLSTFEIISRRKRGSFLAHACVRACVRVCVKVKVIR